MSLPKMIAAMAAPIAGVVLVFGTAVSAQTVQPSNETASPTAPKPAVTSKKSSVRHESGSATPTAKAAKTESDPTTGPK